MVYLVINVNICHVKAAAAAAALLLIHNKPAIYLFISFSYFGRQARSSSSSWGLQTRKRLHEPSVVKRVSAPLESFFVI